MKAVLPHFFWTRINGTLLFFCGLFLEPLTSYRFHYCSSYTFLTDQVTLCLRINTLYVGFLAKTFVFFPLDDKAHFQLRGFLRCGYLKLTKQFGWFIIHNVLFSLSLASLKTSCISQEKILYRLGDPSVTNQHVYLWTKTVFIFRALKTFKGLCLSFKAV